MIAVETIEEVNEIKMAPVFGRLWNAKKFIVAARGSSRSGKTYSLCAMAVLWLLGIGPGGEPSEGTRWSIVRATLPALKYSALLDFQDYLKRTGYEHQVNFNKSELTYQYAGRTVEFFSVQDESRTASRKRNYLHLVECTEFTLEKFNDLLIRVEMPGRVFLDYNPRNFYSWVRTEIEEKRVAIEKDVLLDVSTFRENPFLHPKQIANIEYLKHVNITAYNIFAKGIWGTLENQIFTNWITKNFDIHQEAEQIYLSVDFGFSNDPLAVCLVGKTGRKLYIHELIYDYGQTNQDLITKVKELGYQHLQMVCDNAEPKSIEDLQRAGFRAEASVKGKDSIRHGINLMQEMEIIIYEGSINCIKEFSSYQWNDKKNGYAKDAFNHCIDGIRYVCSNKFGGQFAMKSHMAQHGQRKNAQMRGF